MKKTTIYLVVFIFAIALISCNGKSKNEFKDKRDGHIYKTVKIGEQIWFAENLAYDAGDGCWAYDDDKTNVEKYGYLYTWEVAKTACPEGSHLSSDDEWKELEMHFGLTQEKADEATSRGSTKELKATTDWTKGENGTNESGFSIIPAGYRNTVSEEFDYLGQNANFWTSTPEKDEASWSRSIFAENDKEIFRYFFSQGNGYSVRCIKDK